MLIGLVLSACTDSARVGPVGVEGVEAVTIAALPDGGFVWADRMAGTVHRPGEAEPLVEVDVDVDRQGGLLGLVADPNGRLFISWVAPDRQLLVARIVADGSVEPVWDGVRAPNGGLGGRLQLDADGMLVIGLGNGTDLLELGLGGGALFRLDPDGPPSQTPDVISTGWNNPFAFAVTPGGQLWVADNHPSGGDERLSRADRRDRPWPFTVLPDTFAPSGMAAVSDEELLVCSYTTRRLERYHIDEEGRASFVELVADDCRFDVVLLADGAIVYSADDAIRAVAVL